LEFKIKRHFTEKFSIRPDRDISPAVQQQLRSTVSVPSPAPVNTDPGEKMELFFVYRMVGIEPKNVKFIVNSVSNLIISFPLLSINICSIRMP